MNNFIIFLFVVVALFQQPVIVNGSSALVRSQFYNGKFEIQIRRSRVLNDSYQLISELTNPEYYLKKLSVRFANEHTVDYGGPKKDWLTIVSRRLFNPKLGLFMYSKATNYKVQINPCSGDRKPNHLNYFKFAGTIAGLAIHYNYPLVVSFTIPFLKSVLSKSIELEDIKEADPPLYSALKTVLKEDPKKLGFTFTVQDTKNGRSITRYLPPYKTKVAVTKKNRQEYVKLMLKWKFTIRIRPQIDAFKEGLKNLIPSDKLRRLSEHQLDLKISGRQIIDLKDWKANTVNIVYRHEHNRVVKLFWKMVEKWSNEERAKLLHFVTGSSRVPAGGFKALTSQENKPHPFTIWITDKNVEFVPEGNTCYNRVDIPAYQSLSVMERKFKVALYEGQAGFTF